MFHHARRTTARAPSPSPRFGLPALLIAAEQANEVKYFRFAGGDTLRSVLEDTELVEFPTLLVLTDDELAQGAYSIMDKKDVRNLQRRAEKQSGYAGGEPQAEHRRDGETKNEIEAAVAVPPKP